MVSNVTYQLLLDKLDLSPATVLQSTSYIVSLYNVQCSAIEHLANVKLLFRSHLDVNSPLLIPARYEQYNAIPIKR